MEPEENEELSLEAALGEAFDEQLEGAEDQPPSREYARDEAGRFAAREAEKAAEEAAQAQTQTQPAADKPWRPVWYKDEFGDWQQVAEPFRKALQAREQAFEQKVSEYGRAYSPWRELETDLEPFKDQIAQQFGSPQAYFKQIAQVDQWLAQDPVPALQWIMQTTGVTLDQLRGQGQEGDNYVDPDIAQLRQEIQQVRQENAELRQWRTTKDREAQEAFDAELHHKITNFSKDKPDFDQARPIMAKLMRSGQAATIEDAYEQARWLHPELRERILTDQRKQNVERARAAAVSPRAGHVNGSAGKGKTSLEEELSSQYEALLGGH